MIGRSLMGAALAVMMTAPAAGAQITEQGQQPDSVRLDTTAAQPGQMQQPAMAAATDTMPLDSAFLVHAHSGNIKEVRLGELAAKQAQEQAVKDFGQRMVEAHREAYKASRMIVDTLNAGPLDSMLSEDVATVDRFRNLQGAAFDSAYMRLMVMDHAKEVAAYRNEVQFGNQTMIRRYALQTLPTLRDHFELAQRTARDIGVRVQTPLAGEMQPGANDTTAYMAPGQADTLAQPADTGFMPPDVTPQDTMTPAMPDVDARPDTGMVQPDTSTVPGENVPGQNVPRQTDVPDMPPVQAPADTGAMRDSEP